MITYTLYQKNPASHYIYIDLEIGNIQGENLQLQLPAWRPGRYELGNFAKNIKRLEAFSQSGDPLEYIKLSKDLWQIRTNGNSSIKITYSYFAAELNAGSCYADISQLYVNPVHCCMYVPSRMNEPHRIKLNVPANYKIACSLTAKDLTLEAASFDELADSPFIASPDLQSAQYTVDNKKFHLHFQGICKPDLEKIIRDFMLFTKTQLDFWGSLPVEEYHFLFQITPNRFYHGVEHAASTVIALGPGYAINTGNTYEDLLGVSSHELFHAWNVKAIRPVEMQPYDFTKENYSRTGYVYEGFTTYYGDKLLLSSGAFTPEQYFTTLQERLQKHYHNFGRYNLDVAQSSFDTWLDGYVPGAPYRKTSIYDEGCLVALMLDTLILKATGNKKSLRDVCRAMYEKFGKTRRGYSESDVISLVNAASGTDLTSFFTQYVYAPSDFTEPLKACFDYLGIRFTFRQATAVCERQYGFRVADGSPARITLVAPYSPAWKAGLFAGDEIVALNGMAIRGNLNHWLAYFADGSPITVSYISNEQLLECALNPGKTENSWFSVPEVSVNAEATGNQTEAFAAWLSK